MALEPPVAPPCRPAKAVLVSFYLPSGCLCLNHHQAAKIPFLQVLWGAIAYSFVSGYGGFETKTRKFHKETQHFNDNLESLHEPNKIPEQSLSR